MSTDLEELKLPEQYRASRTEIFPSPQSLAWFMRRHRDAMLQGRAVSRITGRNRIHPERADAVVLAVGEQAARKGIA